MPSTNTIATAAIVLATLLAATGCLTGDKGNAAGYTADLRVLNDTDGAVTRLHLTPSQLTQLGPNQIEGMLIDPYQQVALENVPCGDTYDIRGEGPEGEEVLEEGVYLPCGAVVTMKLTREEERRGIRFENVPVRDQIEGQALQRTRPVARPYIASPYDG